MDDSAGTEPAGEASWTEGHWTAGDGLTLHYRDYPGRADRPPAICIPGLTRNARDFDTLAPAMAGGRRVLCVDLRGRGESNYAKDSATYVPSQYVADIELLLEHTGISRFVAIGTSLGGLVAMMLAAGGADRLAGAVINDIGPVIEAGGLARIRELVGQGRSYPTWMHAARALRDQSHAIYPDFEVSDWLRLAKRLMAVGGSGRIVFDYDMKIAEPFNASMGQDGAAAPGEADWWPCYRALAGRPVLVIRGERSDLLSAATLARMMRELPGAEAVTIPRVGHAPTLEEPEARAAIAALLAKCE